MIATRTPPVWPSGAAAGGHQADRAPGVGAPTRPTRLTTVRRYSSHASIMICSEIFPSRSVIIDSDRTRVPSGYSHDSQYAA